MTVPRNIKSGAVNRAANVTGDSRINTFDVLAIVEYFVDGSEFAIVNYAATVKNAVN